MLAEWGQGSSGQTLFSIFVAEFTILLANFLSLEDPSNRFFAVLNLVDLNSANCCCCDHCDESTVVGHLHEPSHGR